MSADLNNEDQDQQANANAPGLRRSSQVFSRYLYTSLRKRDASYDDRISDEEVDIVNKGKKCSAIFLALVSIGLLVFMIYDFVAFNYVIIFGLPSLTLSLILATWCCTSISWTMRKRDNTIHPGDSDAERLSQEGGDAEELETEVSEIEEATAPTNKPEFAKAGVGKAIGDSSGKAELAATGAASNRSDFFDPIAARKSAEESLDHAVKCMVSTSTDVFRKKGEDCDKQPLLPSEQSAGKTTDAAEA